MEIEIYSDERKAELNLANAVSEEDRREVEKGINDLNYEYRHSTRTQILNGFLFHPEYYPKV